MDIERLRIFADVMRRGSFSAVARERDVDASSISRAVSALESDLGVSLLRRSTRNLAPTEAGVVYFERVVKLIEEFDEARQLAVDAGAEPEGVLRITALVGFAQLNLLPLLPKFSELHPRITFELLLTDQPLDLLAERVDVAIRLGPIEDSSFRTFKLCEGEYVVCASPNYLATHDAIEKPADLENHGCIPFPQTDYRTEWKFRAAGGDISGVPVSPMCVASNGLAVRQCALDGMGPALLPTWLIGADLAENKLVALFPDHSVTGSNFDEAIWVLYPASAYMPRKTRLFVDFLRDEFEKGPPGAMFG